MGGVLVQLIKHFTSSGGSLLISTRYGRPRFTPRVITQGSDSSLWKSSIQDVFSQSLDLLILGVMHVMLLLSSSFYSHLSTHTLTAS